MKDAVYTIEASINFLNAFMSPGFVNDAGNAGVNDRGGAAALRDQQIAYKRFCHVVCSSG